MLYRLLIAIARYNDATHPSLRRISQVNVDGFLENGPTEKKRENDERYASV